MNTADINSLGEELYRAMCDRKTIDPPRKRYPKMTVDDAYAISERFLSCRLAAGESVVGRKIGLTSQAVQQQLGVNEPDFGSLTDDMLYEDGETMPISERLISPKAEGEIAFVLKKALAGPGITTDDVLAATGCVVPCFEIVDSRISEWDIGLVDTVADNASCGLFLLGDNRADPRDLDLSTVKMTVTKDREVVAEGTGAAALGSPLFCVAWLANMLGQYGIALEAGDIVLSGSLVPFLPAVPGTELKVTISGIGEASVRFA